MDHHSNYCALLRSYFSPSLSEPQIVLTNAEHDPSIISHLIETNCPVSTFSSYNLDDPIKAALHFMSLASPELYSVTSTQLDAISITTTFSDNPFIELIHNVPLTTSPITARRVYVQSPTSASLELAWKLEIQMAANWYEAYITSNSIHSVIDWASDISPSHLRVEEPDVGTASYRVFPWDVNDPESGEIGVVKYPHDKIASPWGWHIMPAANDPLLTKFNLDQDEDEPEGVPEGFSNPTSTIGNNVRIKQWSYLKTTLLGIRTKGFRPRKLGAHTMVLQLSADCRRSQFQLFIRT
jgi:hypothetical protein